MIGHSNSKPNHCQCNGRLLTPALFGLASLLLACPLPRERLLRATLVARFQVERVLLDIFDDVFLLDLTLEAAQRALDGLAVLHLDFSQIWLSPPLPGEQCCSHNDRRQPAPGRKIEYARLSPLEREPSSRDEVNGNLRPNVGVPSTMKILVVGGGAREHALVWRLGQEPGVTSVICAPGNAGTGPDANRPLDVSDPAAILALAERESVDLTVVGPELPLVLGVRDLFAAGGRLLFGPSRVAAQLESSKAFAKDFMAHHGVPTARFRVCDTASDALEAVSGPEFGFPVVVKADGLAAGKGVTVAPDRATAERAVRDAMVDGRFGSAGRRVVIEECLVGPEVSFFAVCDGRQALALPTAQDHKRAFDGDHGPNTGGMGAFAPSALVTPDIDALIKREIVEPVLEGFAAQGDPYHGFLYVGLMLTSDGPRVIEFNVRLGDPEAQVVLPMIGGELAPVFEAAARGALGADSLAQTSDSHVGVVLASGGYPGDYETGAPIDGLDTAAALDDVLVFHAGTAARDGDVVTTGGRVLTVVGRGADVRQAIDRAYAAEACITFAGKQVRTDIGRKAL